MDSRDTPQHWGSFKSIKAFDVDLFLMRSGRLGQGVCALLRHHIAFDNISARTTGY
ncbi:hypothetical protein CHELA20_40420 [Hyphomicrobiales bacterium]|nr:hypothetical protein CHELA20_40420 [Hyphomicrobiales bacterium]CAH1688615.1 hypothetical protein CHELA41_40276 [Hyphomicrobiales bacterium]